MELLRKVSNTIKKYELFQPGSKLLVGISGGADSTALALALLKIRQEWDLSINLLHVNHGLRGKESERDEQFVRQLAQKWSLKLYCQKLDSVKLHAGSKGSLEDRARRERYRLFIQCARKIKVDAVALAHHRNDLAETVLMRLIRGAGTRGLAGFLPKTYYQAQLIVRPFFEVFRKEIVAFLRAEGQAWVEDSSNQDKRFLRNKIRLLLIPYLERNFNPAIVKTLSRMAELVAEEELLIEQQARKKLQDSQRLVDKSKKMESLPLSFLNGLPPALLRRLLRVWLSEFAQLELPPDYKYIESLITLIKERPAGRVINLFSSISAYKNYEQIILTRGHLTKKALSHCLWCSMLPARHPVVIMPESRVIKITKRQLLDGARSVKLNLADYKLVLQKMKFTGQLAKEIKDSRLDKTIEYFDFDKLHFPIFIRTRREGDVFQPLGITGKIKLKKFFIDQKIPRLWRDELALLSDAVQILWVIGMRISESAKITPQTRQVLKVRIMREEQV